MQVEQLLKSSKVFRSIWDFALQSNNKEEIIQLLMDTEEEEILKLYEKLRCEVDEDTIPDEVIEELKLLNICAVNVPESHMIETRLAHPPSERQRKALEQLDVITGSQKFTAAEDKIIKRNWKRFKKEYGYKNPKLFMKPYLRNSERIHFVQYLGKDLPKRTLYSIFGRFRRLYSVVNDGPFTAQEDLLIALHLELYDKKDTFSMLAKLLNRERIAVFKRFNYITKNEGTENIKWTPEVIETILKNLVKVTKMDLKKLKTESISWKTWLEVEKCTGFSAAMMKSLWLRKLYTQLYSAKPIYMCKMKAYLVRRVLKTGVQSWQHINWNDIANDFDGVNSLFLWTLMNRMLKKVFPNYRTRNVREMMKFLSKNYIKGFKKRKSDYRLQRIWLSKSGKLVIRETSGLCFFQHGESQKENGLCLSEPDED